MALKIRPEESDDTDAIRRILEAAFPTAAEAFLVARLRDEGHLLISLVAEVDGEVVGHIAFSPVRVDGASPGRGVGLAPVAVHPDHQRRGLGGRLIREGLATCKRTRHGFAVVLGEPAYYRRFGFDRADRRGLGNEYDVSEEFLVIELEAGAIPSSGGVVRYGPEFAAFRD
jgi:putative acetyltransferase